MKRGIRWKYKIRFLKYVAFDTQSDSASTTTPSTLKQLKLAEYLVSEMKELGIQDAHGRWNFGIVYRNIPSNVDKECADIGFIAHMDTAEDMSGKNVNPSIIKNYDGSRIVLNKELAISMGVEEFESFKK